jgi:hypothetical protein
VEDVEELREPVDRDLDVLDDRLLLRPAGQPAHPGA